MRDEDLKGIPQSMTRAARDELLAACGITNLNNLASFSMDARGISAVVYATDETGSRFWVQHGSSERVVATHRIYIPFVDEAPDPDPRPDSMDLAPEDRERIVAAVDAEHTAPGRCTDRYGSVRCELDYGHSAAHRCGSTEWDGAMSWIR